MSASIAPADLRRPGDYKARYERSEYKRMRMREETARVREALVPQILNMNHS